MALSSLRLRRTLSGLSTLHRSLSATTSALSAPRSSASPLLHAAQTPASSPQSWTLLPLQSRAFRSSCLSSARSASYMGNDPKDEIGPDTILFEGCDYNHWLFVMEFPKEKNISPEEMVRTYEETCAKGLNISVEEAKQKMYACSTTTYTGFQAVMTEQEAEKFNDFREVIFVLPDSYIDPANKEYGGDKYINGTIIPRPPPVQYGRQGGRHRDRNRYPDPPRHDRQGPMVNHQGNPSYGQQGPMQVGGNHGASQNYPQQNYGPPRQGDNRAPIPVNTPGGSAMHQPGRDPIPSYQGNYSQGRQQSYYPQEQRNFQQGDQRNYAPPGQGGYRGENMDFGRPHTETQGQGSGGFQGQETALSLGQGPSSGFYGQGPSSGVYGQGPNSGAYGQGPNSGAYGQGPNSGAYGQGPNSGAYGQGPRSEAYGQGPRSEAYGQGPRSEAYGQGPSYGAFGQGPNSGASGHGQSYPVHGGDQRFSQGEQRNVQGEQSNYAPHGTDGH